MIAVLLLAAVALPPNAHAVRIAADTWATQVDITKAEPPTAGEHTWWWSEDCAPTRLTADEPAVDCQPVARRSLRVLDDRLKSLPGAVVAWGTAEMLAEIPEGMLPTLSCGDDGTATGFFPTTTTIYVRAAGPKAASWWQKVTGAQSPIVIRATEASTVRTAVQISGGGAASRSIVELEPVSMTSSASDIRSLGASERDSVAFLPLPKLAVRYTAWSNDGAPQSGVAKTSAFPRSLVLPLGVHAEGFVRGLKQLAVSGAAVEAVFAMPGGARALRRRSRSDKDGHFVVRGLAAGPVQILVRKTGYATAVRSVRTSAAGTAEDFLLRPARTMTVAVVDRAGKPVAAADVRTAEGAHGIAGDDGVAVLDGLPADEDIRLQVRARNFKNTEVRVPVAAKDKVKAVLSRGVRFRVTLLRENHQPAGPGTLMIVSNGGRHVEAFDSSGVVDVGGLSAGTLSVEIRADGATPFTVAERVVADEDEVSLGEMILPKGPSITGHISSRQSGAPVVNAHLRLLRRSSFGPIAAFVMRDWAEGTSRDDGSFSISGFESGPQLLLVEAAGFASRLVPEEVRQDPSASVDVGTIDLDTGREVIVDCTPAARCGTEARLLFAGAEFSWASIGAPLQGGTAHLMPAGSGSATLRLLNGGHVVDERPVEISAQSDATNIRVKLVSALVTGTVTSLGKPLQAGQVQLERVTGASHVMPVYVTSQTPEGQQASSSWVTDSPEMQTASVDASGRFRFEDVQPGTYTAAYRFNGASTASVRVTVPESERYDFPIELPPGELHGRVTDESSRPVALAAVEVRDLAGELHTARSDEAGEFSATGLPAGKLLIHVINHDGEGSAEVDVNPPRVAVAEVVLRKKDKAPVVVSVSDPAGQPLPGAVVFLLGSSALPSAVATTDASGTATLRLQQPLMTPVAVYHGSYGWSLLSARMLGSEETSACAVRMVSGTGCVVVASKTAAAVDLYGPSGISLGGAFSFLGVPVSVAPGSDLRLSGLPPGAYTLRAGTFQTAADVQPGRDAHVTLR